MRALRPQGANSQRIIRSASLMGGMTMVSRLLGYVRDALNAALFGAGWVADAYFVAFRIPNMLRDLVGEGVLSAAVVPAVSRLDAAGKRKEANRLASALTNLALSWGTVLVVAGGLLAPLLVALLAPGFIAMPGKFGLTVSLTRWLFPFIVLVSLAAVLQGLLNARSYFRASAFGPIALNLSIIFTAVAICPLVGVSPEKRIYAWTGGVLLGGAAQWLVQLPAARSFGFRFAWRFRHPGLRGVGALMFPALVGLSVSQLHILVNTILASLLPEGSVAHLYYGNRLQQLPLGVVGVALATAAYPVVAGSLARRDFKGAAEAVNDGLRYAAFAVLPAAAGLFALAPQISGLLFRYGRFGAEDAAITALVCKAYALGIIGQACVRILTPPFYALGRPYQPVAMAGVGVACNIFLSSYLMMKTGVVGLPAATSVVIVGSAVWLVFRLRKLLPGVGSGAVAFSFLRHLGLASGMGAVVWLAAGWAETALAVAGVGLKIREAAVTAGGVALGVLVYAGTAYVFGSTELREIIRSRKRA